VLLLPQPTSGGYSSYCHCYKNHFAPPFQDFYHTLQGTLDLALCEYFDQHFQLTKVYANQLLLLEQEEYQEVLEFAVELLDDDEEVAAKKAPKSFADQMELLPN
jgi:hypothetical protein